MKRKIVVCKWRDAATTGQWTPVEDLTQVPGCMEIITAGIELKRTKTVTKIALSWDEQDKCADTMSIPTSEIISYKVLGSTEHT